MSPTQLRLKELREQAGLSQRALAELAGLRPATIADLERGAADDPRLSTLEALADALGVPLSTLVQHP